MKRFPLSRLAGIVGWTGLAVTWATFGIARAAGAPAAAPAAPAVPDPAPVSMVASTGTTVAVPDLPGTGLVVLRYTPSAPQEPTVVTRVVQQRVVTQAAPRPASQGS
ncbi:MAG: hypothetical protein KQH83_12035 [Actinobacteria bacterium]|nr:hypothetical protein [Actinomycetota bacterium]